MPFRNVMPSKLTLMDFMTDCQNAVNDFKESIANGDGKGITKSVLDLAKTGLNAINDFSNEISSSVLSPIGKAALDKINLVGDLTQYSLTMYESYYKDSEKEFIKKQIGGVIGFLSSTAQKVFEGIYDDLYEAGYINLSDSRSMAENMDYLKGKSVDDWMRLLGLSREDAEKAKAAIEASPIPQDPNDIQSDELTPHESDTSDDNKHSSSTARKWWFGLSSTELAILKSMPLNRNGDYYNYDPLVLDLDGDGIEILNINENKPIYFDHDNNGIKTITSWIDNDDGFLVRDINNDGIINNGGELFGDSTLTQEHENAENGFAALSELDTNKDNLINSDDLLFNELLIWKDLNSDGISQKKRVIYSHRFRSYRDRPQL